MGDLLLSDFLRDHRERDKEEFKGVNGIGPWAAPSEYDDICSSRQRLEFASGFSTPHRVDNRYLKPYSSSSIDGTHRGDSRLQGGHPPQTMLGQHVRTECRSIAEEDDSCFYSPSRYRVLNTDNIYARQHTDSSCADVDFFFDSRRSEDRIPFLKKSNLNFEKHTSQIKDHQDPRSSRSVTVSRNPSPLPFIQSRERETPMRQTNFHKYESLPRQLTQEAEKRAIISMAFLNEARNSMSKIGKSNDEQKDSSDSYVQLWTMLKHPWKNDNSLPKLKGAVRRRKRPENYQIISEPVVERDSAERRMHISQNEMNKLKMFSNIFPNVNQIQRVDQSKIKSSLQFGEQSEFPLGSNLLKRRVNRLSGEFQAVLSPSNQRIENKETRIPSIDTSAERIEGRRKSRLNSYSIQFSPPPPSVEEQEQFNNKIHRVNHQQLRINEIPKVKIQVDQPRIPAKKSRQTPQHLNNPSGLKSVGISFYYKR